ncbi:MAG: YjgB family protein [Lachnotalea sp.]
MKKKLILGILCIGMSVLLISCKQKSDIPESTGSSVDETIDGNNTSDENDSNTNDAGENTTGDDNQSEISDGEDSLNTTTTDSNASSNGESTSSDIEVLLQEIKDNAIFGKVINCDFQVNEDITIQDIQEQWGDADNGNGDYIAAAKGTYYNYSSHKLSFGTNKGDAVFEIRSSDDSLTSITMEDLVNYFGEPDYDVKTDTQEMIGYAVNADYHVLFIFPLPTTSHSNPTLERYNVLYPKGTVNNMADDSGKEW